MIVFWLSIPLSACVMLSEDSPREPTRYFFRFKFSIVHPSIPHKPPYKVRSRRCQLFMVTSMIALFHYWRRSLSWRSSFHDSSACLLHRTCFFLQLISVGLKIGVVSIIQSPCVQEQNCFLFFSGSLTQTFCSLPSHYSPLNMYILYQITINTCNLYNIFHSTHWFKLFFPIWTSA